MADINAIAHQFIQFYYQTFDTNRQALGQLYRPESMLTFENNQILGAQNIIEKLQTFPSVKHTITTFDAQPSSHDRGGLLVLVTGQLKIDSDNAMGFCQVFHLLPVDGAGYYVFNDIFRLSIG